MSTSPSQVLPSLRLMLLPMRAGREARCATALGNTLRAMGVKRADFRSWVELNTGRWKDEKKPPEALCRAVKFILMAADPVHGAALGDKYFLVHNQLITDHFMTHEDARAFLTNSFLMADLCHLERLSGAQISKLLSEGRECLQFSRQSVSFLLESLGHGCTVTTKQVNLLFKRDAAAEPAIFSDSDVLAAAEIVDGTAALLGFPNNMLEALSALAPKDDLAYFPPYLQILHYQCTIAEYYDHAATDMYEFSPRGSAALWLFAQYPEALSSAGNPYLNNAKSVGTLDASWVRSKKQKARPGAKALFDVLTGLEVMRFAARRELAKLLRLWLHRIMRLSEPLAIALPAALNAVQVEAILVGVSKGNTGTFGVIEQRVVDAISAALHPPKDGWRSRGIGDSVNTTNISRRKIGDVDFQNAASRRITAFESHGGELTDVYVDEHLRTLGKIIVTRTDELQGIADLSEWKITVIFAAHRISLEPRNPIEIAGITINLVFETFADFISNVHPTVPMWDQHLLSPLKERRTPREARQVLRTLVGI